MHLFDSEAERADSDEKFRILLNELETAPPAEQQSPMYFSEIKTQWMALAVLCPLSLRAKFAARYAAGAMTPYELALELRVPEATIKAIMADNYEQRISAFLG
jgi:hypothetical protein